ncbi:2-isopropylmalate synthase [Streptomyces mobaraensis NBRC 13819 = DSM 40847]|uniref:2-isopropylmalate synthase n=1 Tax=Streptomyces mobaraensis (strain ATCC 29032 / DSM 40847 / JCM 4168 / NBRC 13819 / NCIMB 11159 / IPCR 16-22) TaxID=1223523 RepID=M3CB63_STRM1|nr:2-isopropylmalate synthase [Streptomyces mobaraensis NBRC 13819 = DSM 40847]
MFTWNPRPGGLDRVGIEDDSLRDGLQGAFVRHPALDEKKALLESSAAIGVQAAMLGFPSASPGARAEAGRLVEHLDRRGVPLVPRFLALADPASIAPITELDRGSDRDVWADFFVGCSPLRRRVEGWTLDSVLDRITSAGAAAREAGTRFGVSLEDATRTPPEELARMVDAAVGVGAEVLTVCDTVGESTPEGAARVVRAVREAARGAAAGRGPEPEIWWHGHDDRGFALANAIAAAEAGADTISGAFLGLGERAGNTALELVVMYLYQAGHPGYRPDRVLGHCRRLAEATGMPVRPNAPLIGDQAFATCTGTHVAALVKARRWGRETEDLVFSSVPAAALGRTQTIMVGPTSGRAAAREALASIGAPADEDTVEAVLARARSRDRWLPPSEIRALLGTGGAPA